MNIVIILRLKRAFARPSLQENRSQAETSATISNTANEKVQGEKLVKRVQILFHSPKASRITAQKSLDTIPEEISTVSQVATGSGYRCQ